MLERCFAFVLCLIGAMLFLTVPSAKAMPLQQTNIQFGESIEAEITDAQYRQTFLFSVEESTIVSITVSRLSRDLVPYVLLVDQSGVLLDYSDEIAQPAQIEFQINSSGVYTIIVTRFGQEHGTTTGEFLLQLEERTTPSSSLASVNDDDFLRYGEERLGEINDNTPTTFYRFQAQRGDVVNITLSRTSGDLDPLIDLFGPDGEYLITGDDDAAAVGTLNARIVDFIIPSTGIYYIQATRYGRIEGSTRGLYILELDAVEATLLGTRPSNARFIEADTPLQSSISAEHITRFFQFEANRGDIITVLVNRTSGDLVPRVSLLRQDLLVLGTSPVVADADSALVPGVSIPVTGTYLISVTRQNGAEGETTGDFTVDITSRPGLQLNDAFEIVYGGQVVGTIDDENIIDNFIFIGTAGDVVSITLRTTDGNLDTLLTLRDEDGKQLTANDDGFDEGRDSLIFEYELLNDGVYLIEASRFERIAGETSGSYILSLRLEN